LGSCNRVEGRFCTKKRKSISVAKRRNGRSKGVYLRVVEKGVYLTIKITIDSTGVFCRKKKMERSRWYRIIGT